MTGKTCQLSAAILGSLFLASGPALAVDIIDTNDTAIIDGAYGEWNLLGDLSFPMYEAGQDTKTHFSNAYLRYDCNSKTMFVLVLDVDVAGGGSIMDDGNYPNKTADNAWVKMDGFNGNMVDGRDDNGGTPTGNPPEFSWIVPNGVEQIDLSGWEGSFKLAPGNYSGIEIHVNMNGGDTSSTGKSGNRIPLTIQCSNDPDPVPSIDIEKSTNNVDADQAPGLSIAHGDAVTWTYAVTNDGEVALSNVTVTDDKVADADINCGEGTGNVIADLAVDETVTCTATATASCPDANASYSNIGTVDGTPDNGSPNVSDTDPSHFTCNSPSDPTPVPALEIDKTTNGSDGLTILVGQAITWTFEVTNTGNVDLSEVVVTDNKIADADINCGDGTNIIASLLVGETKSCTATGVAEADEYENTGCAIGDYDDDNDSTTPPVTMTNGDCDDSNYFGAAPDLDIEKSTQGFDADEATGPFIEVGDMVSWLYRVENTGNVPLVDIVVTDTVITTSYPNVNIAISCVNGSPIIPSLQPGDSFTCSATGTATVGYDATLQQDDPQYGNRGIAESLYTDDEDNTTLVDDEDDSHHYAAQPGIDIEKCTSSTALGACSENDATNHDNAPGAPLLEGKTVVWTYTITNTGNVVLDNVASSDDQGVTLTCSGFDGTLAPGESITCTGSGSVVLGQYENNGCTSGEYTVYVDQDGDPLTTDDIIAETRTAEDCDPSHYYGFSPLQPSIEMFVTSYAISGDANQFNNGTFIVENASGDVGALYLQDVSVTIEYRLSSGNNKWTDVPVDNNCTFDPSFPFVLEGPGEWVDPEYRGQQEFSFSCTAEENQIPDGYSSARATICVQLFNREDKVKGKYTGDEKWFCSSSDM